MQTRETPETDRLPTLTGQPGRSPESNHSLIGLQRTVGNRAVARMVQAHRSAAGTVRVPPDLTRARTARLPMSGTPLRGLDRPRPSTGGTQVQRQDESGPGSTVRAAGDVSVWAGTTMTAEAALREVYQKAAREISLEARRMVAEGRSVEDAARWANQARNDLKVQIRGRGSPITKGLAEARNMRRYGDKVGPTYDQLIREGKTPEDIIGKSGRADVKTNRIAGRMRIAGRLLIAVDIAIVTWEVHQAEEGDRLRTLVGGAAGVGGAVGGGWAGAKAGAWIGGGIGAFFGGVGAPVGAAIGGVIGGAAGAIGGGLLMRDAAEAAYDYVEELVTPGLDEQMRSIDAAEDAFIRVAP